MFYTESEIVASYRQAKYPAQQIGILAELNATTEEHIKLILQKAGIDTVKKYNKAEMRHLYDQGLSDVAIGKAIGISYETVRQWRKKEGLSPNFTRPNTRPKKEMVEPAAEVPCVEVERQQDKPQKEPVFYSTDALFKDTNAYFAYEKYLFDDFNMPVETKAGLALGALRFLRYLKVVDDEALWSIFGRFACKILRLL